MTDPEVVDNSHESDKFFHPVKQRLEQRIDLKIRGASARVGPPGIHEADYKRYLEIFSKKLIKATHPNWEPIIYDHDMDYIGYTLVDEQGGLSSGTLSTEEDQIRWKSRCVALESVVSALYLSDYEVTPLPPETYRVDDRELYNKIDSNHVGLWFLGHRPSGLKTRLYWIPGYHKYESGDIIPFDKRLLIAIQETPVQTHSGKFYKREFGIASLKAIKEGLDILINYPETKQS